MACSAQPPWAESSRGALNPPVQRTGTGNGVGTAGRDQAGGPYSSVGITTLGVRTASFDAQRGPVRLWGRPRQHTSSVSLQTPAILYQVYHALNHGACNETSSNLVGRGEAARLSSCTSQHTHSPTETSFFSRSPSRVLILHFQFLNIKTEHRSPHTLGLKCYGKVRSPPLIMALSRHSKLASKRLKNEPLTSWARVLSFYRVGTGR